MKVNRVLAELYYEAMTHIPTPEYTEDELTFAAELSKEAGLENDGICLRKDWNRWSRNLFRSSSVQTLRKSATPFLSSPSSAATMCRGTSLHHWAAAKQAGMSIGHKGMLYAAR